MPVYRWVAIDAQGRLKDGRQVAPLPAALIDDLHEQDYSILSVRRCWLSAGSGLLLPAKVSPKLLAELCTQLSMLLNTGLVVLDAMAIIADSARAPVARLARRAVAMLVQGHSLSRFIGECSAGQQQVHATMIAVGEQVGDLAGALSRVGEDIGWQMALGQHFRQLLFYPVLVLAALLVAAVFLLVALVPPLADLVESFGQPLPSSMAFLLRLSGWLSEYGWPVLAGLVPAIVLVVPVIRSGRSARYGFDRLRVKIPVLGPLTSKLLLSRLSRQVALLLAAGHELPEALRIGEQVIGNRAIARDIAHAREAILEGQTPGQALAQQPQIPLLLSRMVQIGEQSGTLEQALETVSEQYRGDVERALDRFRSFGAPVLLGLCGGVLGWLIIGVLGPVYTVITESAGASL